MSKMLMQNTIRERAFLLIKRAILVPALVLSLCASMAQAAEKETFTLNLKDANISALISTIAKKTGKNFVVDPRVKAKVTIISNQEMDSEELYGVFLSVLQVHGYAAVPTGDVIKILPDVNAKQGPVPTVVGRSALSDQLVTRVVPIKNVAASQLVPILRPLVPQQGHLAAYAGSNIIVVTDRAANIQRLVDIIKRIDRPDNDEIEFVQLHHASATEVVRILNSLRQNAANKGGGAPDAPQLASDERTNSVLVSGSKAARARIRALIASLDSPLEQGGNTKVIYLKYAKATDLADILRGVNEGQRRAAQSGGGSSGAAAAAPASSANAEIDIQADEETNALIITAAPDAMRNVEAVIRQLDIRRAQVHVEALIVEVSDSAARELGISYVFGNELDNDNNGSVQPLGGAILGSSGQLLNSVAAAVASGSATSTTGLPGGFSLAFGDRDSSGNILAGILRAVKTDAGSNILATPSIVTLDNEEAEIVVGQNVPFQTGSFTTSGSGATNPFQTVERQDVGTMLKITPQINEGSTVRLDIEQEASSVADSQISGQIVTNTRTLTTSVMVEDGQLLVLGGLVDDRVSNSVAKIPLLGDIPLLGRLFQSRSKTKQKINLMVFLRPTILKDRAVADALSHEKYNFIRAQQIAAQQGFSRFSADTAILPEIMLTYAEEKDASESSEVSRETTPVDGQEQE